MDPGFRGTGRVQCPRTLASNTAANRKSLKMADPGQKFNQELARSAAKNVDGVRSVVWLDHENLFVIVKENAQRSSEMIDQICMELEPPHPPAVTSRSTSGCRETILSKVSAAPDG